MGKKQLNGRGIRKYSFVDMLKTQWEPLYPNVVDKSGQRTVVIGMLKVHTLRNLPEEEWMYN